MGQDSSTLIDESAPTQTLEKRTVEALAKYIKEGHVKNIVVMVGAGISTSAGIPDFRSPDTGLYANLARLNLPYAEAVFDISYFRQHPEPFYTLAQELYPGKYRPTITHSFIKLLHDKGLLLKCFTQNIDCLEREAGVPGSKVVEAHGSFAGQKCIECREPYPDDLIKRAIHDKTVPHCASCNGLVKPNIVFFGEALPEEFFNNRSLPSQADLAIVMGSSLSVQPFASLPQFCSEGTPRLLVNMEVVGDLGSRPDDVLLLGDCDKRVRQLATALGWLDELEALWSLTQPVSTSDLGREKRLDATTQPTEEVVEDEVEKLTREVEETLAKTASHKDYVTGYMEAAKNLSETDTDGLDKLARQVEASLRVRDSEQEYLDRQMDIKTGIGHSEVLATALERAAESSHATAGAKEQSNPGDKAVDPGGETDELKHVFPFDKLDQKKSSL